MSDRQITRHEDGSSSWLCQKPCKETVWRFPGTSSASCTNCNAQYNIFGQRLRSDWRGNPSNYNSDIGDMEGYEIQHAGE